MMNQSGNPAFSDSLIKIDCEVRNENNICSLYDRGKNPKTKSG